MGMEHSLNQRSFDSLLLFIKTAKNNNRSFILDQCLIKISIILVFIPSLLDQLAQYLHKSATSFWKLWDFTIAW